jgi:hypothetical protein
MHYDEAAVALSDESFQDSEKQKQFISLPHNKLTDGIVSMSILQQNELEFDDQDGSKRGYSFKCKTGLHGHTVLCTDGRIAISVPPKDEIPREVTVALAHAAYLRDSEDEFTIKSVKHHASSCAVICSISSPTQSEMAIKIGGSHVHFVFYAYPDPPEEKTFLWYKKLPRKEDLSIDFSWKSRLRVFRKELKKFIADVKKKNPGNLSLKTLSWPGPIRVEGKYVSETKDHRSQMEAHVLGCEKTTLEELIGGFKDIHRGSCLIMSLAAADIAAERKEFGGRLYDESGNTKPGLLLNFSSEICMAAAGEGNKQIELRYKRSDDGDLHLSLIDQWFCFDPLTRDWSIQKISHAESSLPFAQKRGRRAIRLCDLLSTTAVVFRFLSEKIGESFLKASSNQQWHTMLDNCRREALETSVDERALKFRDLIDKYRPHLNVATEEVFNWITKECNQNKDIDQFVAEIGRDYGDLLAALYAELQELRDVATIVLGGYGGVHFGNTEDDLFLKTVNDELGFHKDKQGRVPDQATVVRAQASGSSNRLLRAGQWRNLIGGDK